MPTYTVAKANETARAYVARTENLKPFQIVLDESNSFTDACAKRDAHNAKRGY